MTQTVELDGVRHDFPDDATQAEIAGALLVGARWRGTPGGGESLLGAAVGKPITSVSHQPIKALVQQATDLFGKGYGDVKSGSPLKGVGEMALGGLEYVTAPINAPIHTIVGKPVADATGSETAGTCGPNSPLGLCCRCRRVFRGCRGRLPQSSRQQRCST